MVNQPEGIRSVGAPIKRAEAEVKPGRRQGRALQLLLAIFLSAATIASAQNPPSQHHFRHVEQDGQGVLWAVENQLFIFNGREWSEMPTLFAKEDRARPMRLTRLQDGSMACVWQMSNQRFEVTRHTVAESRLLGQCAGEIKNSGLNTPPFADSRNRLWITDSKPEIYRADPDGKVALEYSIKPEELINAEDIKARYGKIFASEDGRGRVWVWSNSWAGGMNGAALRGVLIFDGDKVTQREKFGGINEARFSFIDRKDDKQMWVAAIKEGVFAVDIDTLEAQPLAEPEPGAFQWVKKIFSAHDDLFVIAARTGEIFKNALWRLHGGKWARLIENVDNRPNPGFDFNRPWLRAGRDVILCSYDSAPWIIRENGAVDRLDFQHGLTIEDARSIFFLTDGRFSAAQFHSFPAPNNPRA